MNAIKWMGSLLVLLSFFSIPLQAANQDFAQRAEIRRLKNDIEAAFSTKIPAKLKAYIESSEMQSPEKLRDVIAVATYQSLESDFILYNIRASVCGAALLSCLIGAQVAVNCESPVGATASALAGISSGVYGIGLALQGTWAAFNMSAADRKRYDRKIKRTDDLYKKVKAAFYRDPYLRFAYTGR